MQKILKEILAMTIERSQETTLEYFIHKNFKYYDLNNSNTLSPNQFKKALKRVGVYLSSEKSEQVMDFYKDEREMVDYKQFMNDLMHNSNGIKNENNDKVYSSNEYIHALGILEKEMNKKNILFCLMPAFLKNDFKFEKTIDYKSFIQCIKQIGFNFPKMESYLKIIFYCLDKNLNGKIFYYDFLLLIVRELSESRSRMTLELFKNLKRNRKLNLIAFKTSYKINNHPDFLKGIRNRKEIEKEMDDCLQIFEKFKQIKRFGENDFFELIQFLTSAIDMDRYFKFFIEKFFDIKIEDNLEESTYSYLSKAETESKLERLTQKYSNTKSTVADESISQLKNYLLKQGLLSVLLFLKQIYGQDPNFKDQLSLKNFRNIIKISRVNISENDLLNIFKYFQKDNYNEFMTITKLHKYIVGSLPSNRKDLIKKKFIYLDYKKNGKIYLEDIRDWYKPKEVKKENEIFFKLYDPVFFMSCVNGYNDFMRNNKNYLNQVQFLDFYRYLSLFFDTDSDFEDYLKNTWKKFYADSKYEDFQKGNNSVISSAPFGLYKENVGDSFDGKNLNKKKISLNLVNQGRFAGRRTDRSLNLSSKRSYNRRKTNIHESEKLNEEFRANFLKSQQTIKIENFDLDNILEKIRKKNLLSIFELLSSFKKCDYSRDYFLEIKDFNYIILKKYPSILDVKNIDIIIDNFKDNNRINYQEFMESIKIPLNSSKKTLLKKLFAALDIFQIDYVLFNVMKSSFNAKKHPKVLDGKVPDYEIYQGFFDSLYFFCKIFKINKKKDIFEINLSQFLEFFDYYNMEVRSDEDFEQFVNGCFAQKMNKLK